MRKLSFLLTFLCLAFGRPVVLFAQIDPATTTLGRMVPASPEASAIALYQNYPVDFVSGAPNIEIPLFDVPTRAGVIPLKLSYHIGKLKPSELTGGPGFGWTLTPNLGVSRSIRGKTDGVNTGYPANSQFGENTEAYFLGATLYALDEQPDDFYYSLLGKSGQFVYNRDGGFTTVTYDPVKIFHPDDNTFIITDEDGTIYRFGKYSIGSVVRTEYAGGGNPPINLAAWKITEIIPYDKSDVITFIYGNPKNTYQVPYYNIQWQIKEFEEVWDPIGGGMHPVQISATDYENGSSGVTSVTMRPTSIGSSDVTPLGIPLDFTAPNMGAGHLAYLTNADPGSAREERAWSGLNYGTTHQTGNEVTLNVTEQLPLTEIRFKGGTVTFEYTSNKQLSSVVLYSGSTLVKKARLFQHPLTHPLQEQPVPYYENLNARFALNMVKISGPDETKSINYQVEYDNTQTCGVYGNLNTDYWGFVNGKGIFTVPSLLYKVDKFVFPTCLMHSGDECFTTGVSYSGAWATVGTPQEKTAPFNPLPGMIKKLIFPTGGFAEFTFEVNQYPSPTNYGTTLYGGGYRIKQIDYKTGDGRESISKRYKYGIDEDGIGRVKYKNYYENFVSVQYVNSTKYGQADNDFQKITTVNSKPHLNMSFASGAAVLYQQVTEYTVNPADNRPLGKTVYDYVIDSKNDDFIQWTPIHKDPRDDWKIISFKAQKNYRYNEVANSFSLVSQTEYDYTDFIKEQVPVAETFIRYYNAGAGIDFLYGTSPIVGNKFAHADYNIITGARKLTEIKETVYNPDNLSESLVSLKTIEYDPVHLYKKSETLTDSKGLFRKTEYLHPHQAGEMTSLSATQQTLVAGLVTANRILQPIETREYNNNGLQRTVQQNFAQYPDTRIFPSAVYNSILGDNLEKRIEVGLYDSHGNILEQRKADDAKEVYLWGYDSRYPVAKVTGSDFNTVQSFVSQLFLDEAASYTDEELRTELQKIRTGLASTKAQVLTYTYKPLVGVTSETDARGRTTYYEYDNHGRLHLVKDHEDKILKMICYNYAGQPEDCGPPVFYSNIRSAAFQRNNCGAGYTGSTVTYTVPSGTYTSSVSQAAADQLAQDDIDMNGQAYANTNGSCMASSLSISYMNYGSGTAQPITFRFTNTATGVQYVRATGAGISSGTLSGGGIPEGTYNVQITNPNGGSHSYTVGCYYSISGVSPLTITNVYIGQTCPMVFIDQ